MKQLFGSAAPPPTPTHAAAAPAAARRRRRRRSGRLQLTHLVFLFQHQLAAVQECCCLQPSKLHIIRTTSKHTPQLRQPRHAALLCLSSPSPIFSPPSGRRWTLKPRSTRRRALHQAKCIPLQQSLLPTSTLKQQHRAAVLMPRCPNKRRAPTPHQPRSQACLSSFCLQTLTRQPFRTTGRSHSPVVSK